MRGFFFFKIIYFQSQTILWVNFWKIIYLELIKNQGMFSWEVFFPFPNWSNGIYKNVSMNTNEHILYEGCLFGPNFLGRWTRDPPEQDLAKFGYE